MTCEEVRAKLSRYLDLELSYQESQAVREHLAICEGCAARLGELREADDEIKRALLDVPVPAGFAARVAAAARPRPRSWKWLKPAAVAAAILMAVLAGVTLYVNHMEAPPLSVAVHGGDSLHAGSIGALRVFVSHAQAGLPVADAAVRVFLGGKDLGRFVTGAAGTIEGFFRVPDLEDGNYPLRLGVKSPLGDGTSQRSVAVRREYRRLLTTDKPMYQPGQTIRMRALALNAFTLKPRPGRAEFEVVDSKGNRVFTQKAELSEFGIAAAEMQLADEVNLGTYRAAVTASGIRQERTVEVAQYVLPKFKVELELDKASYRPGGRVKGTVRAKYFFGKPVRGMAKASVDREIVTGELREDGSWEFEAPAPGEGAVKVEVAVTDTADHRETKSTVCFVTREALKVDLVPEGGEVVRGIENAFYVLVSTPDGRPAKADVDLVVNGAAVALKTDDLGVAKVTAPDPYEIRLERARDEAGNEAREMRSHAKYGSGSFLLRLDKAAYKGGETMTATVLGGGKGPVYVDLVKGGQLLLAKVAEKGRVEIDLPPDLFGTVQVIAYRRDTAPPVTRVAYVNLPDGLRIRPRAAKDTFRPGEEMPVEFEVTDREGRPIQAALGIAVVDEALYGLVVSKAAGEKAWLSLAPELIDTRGFLRAEAAEIYQGGNTAQAQRFVSGNGRAERPGLLTRNAYEMKAARLKRFVEDYNAFVGKVLKVAGSVVAVGMGILLILMPLIRALKTASGGSWIVVLVVVHGVAWITFLTLMAGVRWEAEGLIVLTAVAGIITLGLWMAVYWIKRDNPQAVSAGFFIAILGIVAGLAIVFGGGDRSEMSRRSHGGLRYYSRIDGEAEPSSALPPAPMAEPPRPSTRELESLVQESRLYAPEKRVATHVLPPLVEAARPATPEAPSPEEPARVREYFPETLFWMPQLITDERGRAKLTLPPADSITSWRMLANAVARNGALGFEGANLRVFQDFFADIDFPVALTRGDRVHVPVAVYNYLKEPQTVAVRVQREPWFELLDEETKSVSLKPSEVSVVYFGLKVREHGRKTLTVFADGKVKDALRRSVEVMEKGREVPISMSDRVQGRREFKVEIPERAIEGASVVFVRLTPGAGDLVAGLEGLVRMPYG